jgi:hypothetical protein
MEQRLSIIKEVISRSREDKEAALILIKQVIPCIMHLENCGGEKIITIILSIGAERYQLGRGTSNQWKFPMKDDKKEVSLAL